MDSLSRVATPNGLRLLYLFPATLLSHTVHVCTTGCFQHDPQRPNIRKTVNFPNRTFVHCSLEQLILKGTRGAPSHFRRGHEQSMDNILS